MIGVFLILGVYVAMVVLCLWLQAVHYKLEDMEFDGFNILYAFIPFSFVGPLFAVVACVLDGAPGIAAKVQKVLIPK